MSAEGFAGSVQKGTREKEEENLLLKAKPWDANPGAGLWHGTPGGGGWSC